MGGLRDALYRRLSIPILYVMGNPANRSTRVPICLDAILVLLFRFHSSASSFMALLRILFATNLQLQKPYTCMAGMLSVLQAATSNMLTHRAFCSSHTACIPLVPTQLPLRLADAAGRTHEDFASHLFDAYGSRLVTNRTRYLPRCVPIAIGPKKTQTEHCYRYHTWPCRTVQAYSDKL